MAISNFPQQGGGGIPDWNYINSIRMETYNRSWTQSGSAGMYVLISSNKNNGYAYFVSGGSTTGIPLGNIVNLTSSFTRIDIIAPQDDYISLYKVAAKSTGVFNNPFSGFSSFPSIITSSGNFVLPSNALPLVNALVLGAGGGGHGHSSGGGGGGVISLNAYQAVGTTSCTIGAHANNSRGGDTYFGNVYALGGGGGSYQQNDNGTAKRNGANGAGAGGNGSWSVGGSTVAGGTGTVQTSSTGIGTKGSPQYWGGNNGGSVSAGLSVNHGGAAGGGATGAGGNRTALSGTTIGGTGIANDITGTFLMYGTGGGGSHHSSPASDGAYPTETYPRSPYSCGTNSRSNDFDTGGTGAVIVRYYIA